MPDTLPLRQASAFFGVPVKGRTLYAWVTRGIRDRRGNTVKLRPVKIGGRLYLTRAAAEAFLEATAEAAPVPPKPTRREEAEGRRREEEARRFLQALAGSPQGGGA